MIIASWNVNSISVRLPHLLEWLKQHQPHVMCLQETKTVDEKFPLKPIEEAGYHCEFHGEKAYNGVAVLSRQQPSFVQKGFPGDAETASRRFLEVKVGPLHVLNVYVPNGSEVGSDKYFFKLKWFEQLKHHLRSRHKPGELLIVCGDFNVAPEERDVYDPVALANQILFSPDERAALESVKEWGLVDTFRQHNQEAGQYSWWDYRMAAFRRNMGLRIDHILATRPASEKCTRAWIDKEPRKLEKPADHAPVAAEFSV
ncbi:MAG TPA: exodeoxyribonuclease III [Candidatus Obscuribacterales bacterium]